MDGCLKLNLIGRYALSAAVFLTWKFKKRSAESSYFSLSDLARAQRIPKPFLAKIMQSLVKKGLIQSKKGVGGGVTLNRTPEEISVLEIIETCEGSYTRSSCIFYPDRPCSGSRCPIYCPLRKEEETIKKGLSKISMERLAHSLENHPERI